jgi:predicted nucleic acid-binding protein
LREVRLYQEELIANERKEKAVLHLEETTAMIIIGTVQTIHEMDQQKVKSESLPRTQTASLACGLVICTRRRLEKLSFKSGARMERCLFSGE